MTGATGWPTGRLPDRDAFDKCLLDALTRCGLLLDDGEKGVEGRMAVELVRGPKATTVIVLTDVDN